MCIHRTGNGNRTEEYPIKYRVVVTMLPRSVPLYYYYFTCVVPKVSAEHVFPDAEQTLTVTLQRRSMVCQSFGSRVWFPTVDASESDT